MTTIREFAFEDLFKFNRIFFDPLTEVYPLTFLIPKILKFPDQSEVAIAPNEQLVGFLVGNNNPFLEDRSNGHVSLLSIEQDYRRLGLGRLLMQRYKVKSELQENWFVDLYVRSTNLKAIELYLSLGFVNFRWLPYFYETDHGYEMRLPLAADVDRICLSDGPYLFDRLIELLLKFYLLFKNGIQNFFKKQTKK